MRPNEPSSIAGKPAGRLVSNLLFLMGGEAISKLLTLAAIAFMARIAGPVGFGYLEFAASLVLVVGLLLHQGFGLYGAREIARDPSSTGRLVAEITSIRFVLALLAYGGLYLLVRLMDRPPALERLILLYGLSLLVMPWMLQWVFQGHERMRAVAALQIARQVVFAGVVFLFLRDPDALWPAAIGEITGVASVAIISFWLYWRHFGGAIPPPARVSMRVARAGAVIGLSRIFWSTRIFGATVVVGLIAAEQDVGFFGAAMRLLVGLYVFVWLYYINLLPSLSRACHGTTGGASLQRLVDRSMHAVGWLGVSAGALGVLLSPLAIRLAYGGEFAPAAPALQFLALVCVLAAIHGHYRFALIAANRERDEMLTSALGTLVSLPLIPVGYFTLGVSGAALALVGGEVAIWISSWVLCHRRLRLGGEASFLVRPVACVALLAGIFWALPEQTSLVAQVALAAIVLGVGAFVIDPMVRRGATGMVLRWRDRPKGQRDELLCAGVADGDEVDRDSSP